MMRSASCTVASFCIREVVTVTRETPVLRCAQLMHDEHVGAVVITDEIDGKRVPVGMLTDRDIAIEVVAFDVAALEQGRCPTGLRKNRRSHREPAPKMDEACGR